MKLILGLDVGIASIGWALIKEFDNQAPQISKVGVRVVPISTKEQNSFKKGDLVSSGAEKADKKGARRNLQRFKLRRKKLIDILIENKFIHEDTPLTEIGKQTTHQTSELRAAATDKKISLEELAKVFLSINKKRGYKSSRKTTTDEDGQAIDTMAIAIKLSEQNSTPAKYVLDLLKKGEKYIPDFYPSDLQLEFDKVWNCQKKFYPKELTNELYEKIINKNIKATWAICKEPFNLVGIKLKEKSAELKRKKYELRVEAVSQKLDLEYFVIVLQEINKDLNKSSSLLGKISDRSKELYFNKQTIGEYLHSQTKENIHQSLKNQVFYRQDYIDEFEKIWDTQSQFHKELNEDLREEMRDVIIFYQRKLKSQKSKLSFCELESKEINVKTKTGKNKTQLTGSRVIPKSSFLFQYFKVWQQIHNIKIYNEKQNIEFEFTLEMKKELFEFLTTKERCTGKEALTYIFRKSKEKPSHFSINYDELETNTTYAILLKKCKEILELENSSVDTSKMSVKQEIQAVKEELQKIGITPKILDFQFLSEEENVDIQESYQLWHLFYSYQDDNSKTGLEALHRKLYKKFGFKTIHAQLIGSINFKNEYGNYSTKAIRKILPLLQEGKSLTEAKQFLFEKNPIKNINYQTNKKSEIKENAKLEILTKNSLRNPVVEKIINQMINIVNQLTNEYGKIDEIRIELARELKKSSKERKQMDKVMKDNTKRNRKIKNIISKDFHIPNPKKNDVIRYLLWQELSSRGDKELFTNRKIPYEKLFSSEVDIEHIIPKSVRLDDSFSNKTLTYKAVNIKKSNRTGIDFISQDYNSELKEYIERVESLYDKGKGAISKTKRNNLLLEAENISDGFIERDLRNTQYIAKKSKEILGKVANVVATTGSITERLRKDWELISVMKELSFPTYEKLGLTEIEERLNVGTGEVEKVPVITDWSKRNDHRHHAMDALTVAFTTHNHIQYINYLNARRDEKHKKHSIIKAIEQKITEVVPNKKGKKKRKFISPIPNFREEAKMHIESILVSHKAKNKVATKNINIYKTKNGTNQKEQLTPRGSLHKETVYAKKKIRMQEPTVINQKFTLEDAKLIVHPKYKEIVLEHLNKFENNPIIAFDTETLKKQPIVYKNEILKEVLCFKIIYTIRKSISSDLFIDSKKKDDFYKQIDKVIGEQARQVLKSRYEETKLRVEKENLNRPIKDKKTVLEEAFSDLDKNPIWLNKEKGICIKTVTVKGVNNVIALHKKKDHLGREIQTEDKEDKNVDFVSTGNNHHLAVYVDEDGNLQDEIVSFYEAVRRKTNLENPLPIVDKQLNKDKGWKFLFTLKINEMFVFSSDDFDPNQIDLMDSKNATLIGKHLYRVQSISKVLSGTSFVRDFVFRHHLDSTTEKIKELKDKNFIQLKSLDDRLKRIVKVRLNHLGKIVHIGE